MVLEDLIIGELGMESFFFFLFDFLVLRMLVLRMSDCFFLIFIV